MDWGADTLAEAARVLGATLLFTAFALQLQRESRPAPLTIAVTGALLLALGSVALLISTVAPVALRREESLAGLALEYLEQSGHGARLLAPLLPAVYALLLFLALRTAVAPLLVRGIRWVLAATLCAIPLLLTAGGHGGGESMGRIAMLAKTVHLASGFAWAGLVLGLMPRLLRGEPLAAALTRIGNVAAALVVALLVSGVVTAWRHGVRTDWLTTEAYGQLLLIKTVLLTLALAAAGWNRRVGLAARATADLRVRPVLAAEALLLLAALTVAAWLARTPPPG